MTDDCQYADIHNPVGHRFGRLTSKALIVSAKTGRPTGVLFVCDCGRHARASIRRLQIGGMPTRCKRCSRLRGFCRRRGGARKITDRQRRRELRQLRADNQYMFRLWDRRQKKRQMTLRWMKSFANFFYDMGPQPFPHACLCRHNVRRKHSPNNTYWGFRGQDFVKHPFLLNGRQVTPEILRREYGIRLSFTNKWRKHWKMTPQQIIDKWNADETNR